MKSLFLVQKIKIDIFIYNDQVKKTKAVNNDFLYRIINLQENLKLKYNFKNNVNTWNK